VQPIINRPSPNFDERAAAVPLQFVVLHYTGMLTRDDALQRLCDLAAKVSAHYLIDEVGETYALVDESKRAWHAGKSFWRGITDLNSASIGIELVNPGHEYGYRPFPPAQIAALKKLLKAIFARYSFNAAALLAHSDIAPTRKQDPGELFPWRDLAADGFGLWPDVKPDDHTPADAMEKTQLLRHIGYDCATAPDDALLAFQRRFDPENLGKKNAHETAARLRALAGRI